MKQFNEYGEVPVSDIEYRVLNLNHLAIQLKSYLTHCEFIGSDTNDFYNSNKNKDKLNEFRLSVGLSSIDGVLIAEMISQTLKDIHEQLFELHEINLLYGVLAAHRFNDKPADKLLGEIDGRLKVFGFDEAIVREEVDTEMTNKERPNIEINDLDEILGAW
ncbi:hypothetical protein [Vibrio bivalvicida]|uniref:Uncharacterized protein n=1 Tax=Vibrio bivalvicida TaxID=1276888 RepID=A0A177XVS0_9VIBR|nr:hypothetical protein [Vibrio bivalvicida]OAJ92436.1 hypothetical protein APB76_20800 [Vibrio bivalvicida]